ncbi:hypothetical protein CFC21_023913 [Triticum aestivum]|uniref:F-box domain-containing protein n=3 Tax=Triticum TaxID=4564 RepID=A0A9R1RNU0_TRITD|nr:putative F-box/LRR-repeat protein 23 [Triticum dicoccoides]XP_044319988.1 putative F-box/LRR-repeat protein 23 [Triticum aestivum]KAF7009371.1 hypothetical protein CFC21_023913 [Triticum aestivum]VAH48202.1 unnamed protein product [Triticum turgidum subsp. durum]
MAAAAPSPSRNRPEGPPSEEEAARDWAGLPWDALLAVLHRLDHVDVLMGAGLVCSPWRCAARNEPELWRRVEVRSHADRPTHVAAPSRARRHSSAVLCGLARAAVKRAAGQCEAFCGEGAVDDSVLSLLADVAPSLKSLRIISGDRIVDERLRLTITNFALLEELELSLCTDVYPGTCEAVGSACPLLKRFRLSKNQFCKWNTKNIDQEAMAIATMGGLRSLQLFANPLSDDGLAAILDGCPRLESLDIRHCFNVGMGAAAIRARCPGIETLRLPGDSTMDYDLKFSHPDMTPWNTQDEHHCDWHELVYFSSW